MYGTNTTPDRRGRELYEKVINGLLDLDDIRREKDIMRILEYARVLNRDLVRSITQVAEADEEQKGFDYWAKHFVQYGQSKKVVELLTSKRVLKDEILPPQPIVKQKPELRINQIALKYAYEGLQITRENGNEIAKEYGHNSGEKLFQRFTYFSSSANRKGKPNLCTPKKLDNKIKLIESIVELLPTDKQGRAKDEVLILKRIYETEYQ